MKNQQSQTSGDQSVLPRSLHFPNYLLRAWSLYGRRRGKHGEGSQGKELPLATVRTLDQFFAFYLAMKLPSEYEVDVKVMLFEEKCVPRWEEWVDSGCLLLQFRESKDTADGEVLDKVWEYLVFGLVGNQLDNDIIGLCLNKHEKQTLVEVWLRRKQNHVLIGKRIEELIEHDLHLTCAKLKKSIKLSYKDHRLSIEHNSTMKGTQKLVSIHSSRTT